MDTEHLFETNINTVIEMILDEEKLVTYITISKDLCIHVNSSKQLISSAVQKIRKDHPNIQFNITYLISGLTSSNTAVTTICTETELDKLKESLTVVFFYHVYGICKGSPGVDSASFLLLNKYEDYTLCAGIIRSKECIKWTSDEIENLKTNSQDTGIIKKAIPLVETNSNKNLKQGFNHVSKAQINGHDTETKAAKEKEIKSEIKTDVDVISPKKEHNNKQTAHKTNGAKAQKGIASFFNKSNGQKNKLSSVLQNKFTEGVENKKPSNESSDSKLGKETMDVDKVNIEVDTNIKKDIRESKESKQENIIVKKEPVSVEKNKSLNKIKKSNKVDKKRKRLIHVSDSEDDDDPFKEDLKTNDAKMESDDEIPSTPSANNIKITSGFVHPKKRRKVVDKTYTSEDGYILTKKEEIYESCSENEDEVKIEKKIKIEKEIRKVDTEISPKKITKISPKKSKKKISPPQKGKQLTLNRFFSKK